MSDVPASRELIQIEDCAFRSAVSESLMEKVGATTNFINLNHLETKTFGCQGIYNGAPSYTDLDSGHVFAKKTEIAAMFIKNRTAGNAGTTEFNIYWKPQGTGTWQSIFDATGGGVTPKILPTAANYEACGIGQVVTGFVAPVLTKTQFNAGDMLRVDMVQVMGGNPTGAALTLFWRPI